MTQRYWSSDELNTLHAEVTEAASRAALDSASWECDHRTEGDAAPPAPQSTFAPSKSKFKFLPWDYIAPAIGLALIVLAIFATKLSTNSKQSQTDLATVEERDYLAARGNIFLLRSYVSDCKVCAHKFEANSEIQRIQEFQGNQRAQAEESAYRAARGNPALLRNYLQTCQICAFANQANSEISKLNEDAKYAAFEVCNSTLYDAAVATMGRRNASVGDYSIEGWWEVKANSCAKLGRFAKGTVYAVARVRNSTLGWRGADAKLCVAFPGPFNRMNRANYTCGPNEKLESFRSLSVTTDYTWRLNDAPTESDDRFTFTVCNKSGIWAAVAVSGVEAPGSNSWVVRGWWKVAPGQCADIGKFARGTFYALAEELNNPQVGWKGHDINLCVQYPGPFNRINSGGETCSGDELQPFTRFYVTSSAQTWILP